MGRREFRVSGSIYTCTVRLYPLGVELAFAPDVHRPHITRRFQDAEQLYAEVAFKRAELEAAGWQSGDQSEWAASPL